MIPRVNFDLVNSQNLDDPCGAQNEGNRENDKWNQSCYDNLDKVIEQNKVVREHAGFSYELYKYLDDVKEHSVNKNRHPHLVGRERNLSN